MMFVSYSRSDMADTRPLVESLAATGVECWLDESNIPVGQAFVERLGAALSEADCFLLVDTPASRSSYWVWRELQTSSRYRREGRYHSVLRVFSLDCKCTDVANWDASVPLSQRAPDHIAKFLAGRNTAQHLPDLNGELGTVSFLTGSGLGQPRNWTGRQDELRALDEWWFGSLPGAWLRGLGGSGKSGLLQTWVAALSYLGYAKPVSASGLYLRGSQVEVTEAEHLLSEWEATGGSASRLLLLDGHDEARTAPVVEEVVAQAIHLGARILVTSRRTPPHQFAGYFKSLTLDNMTRRDSVAILNEFGVTGPCGEKLAAELGDHPLALLVLSRSLANGNVTAADALEDLRRVRAELSAGSSVAPASIRATLSKSVGGLTSDARLLLKNLCRTSEDGVEPPALTHPAINELAHAGLVQVDHFGTPSQLSIHPLVRSYVNAK